MMTADDFAEHVARVRERFASRLNDKIAASFAALEKMSAGGGDSIETVIAAPIPATLITGPLGVAMPRWLIHVISAMFAIGPRMPPTSDMPSSGSEQIMFRNLE
jgi:hypothetical protein